MNKLSYPEMPTETNRKQPFNIEQWVQILRGIESLAQTGKMSYSSAHDSLTGRMDKDEREHFDRWVKFYKANNPPLYAMGGFYYTGDEGYVLPIPKSNFESATDVNLARDLEAIEETKKKEEENNRKQKVKQTKKRLVSRLDSVEKLIRSEEGQELIDDEYDFFVEAIYDLKKKVHKLTIASTNFLEDLIIRHAGQCNKKGFGKSAVFFAKLADSVRDESELISKFACNVKFNDITTPSFLNLLSLAEDPKPSDQKPNDQKTITPPTPPSNDSTSQNGSNPVDELKKKVDPTLEVKQDKQNAIDDVRIDLEQLPRENRFDEVEYGSSANSLNNFANIELDLISLADEVPASKTNLKNYLLKQKIPEIKTKDVQLKPENNFDVILDSALKNVRIEDIIEKLESISNIHHIREISRQLALVDIMLQVLGLSGLFPSLSEAMNKSLESSNYISSRVDEILANLRSIIGKNTIELEKEPTIVDDNVKKVRDELTSQKDRDEERKRARKEVENQRLDEVSPGTNEENIELAEEPTVSPNIKPTPAPIPKPEITQSKI
jgi:hypothetical protein